VAVVVFGIVAVFHPFLELAPFADFGLEEFVAHGGDFGALVGVDVESFAGFDEVSEEAVDDFLVIEDAFFEGAVFGGPAVGGD